MPPGVSSLCIKTRSSSLEVGWGIMLAHHHYHCYPAGVKVTGTLGLHGYIARPTQECLQDPNYVFGPQCSTYSVLSGPRAWAREATFPEGCQQSLTRFIVLY